MIAAIIKPPLTLIVLLGAECVYSSASAVSGSPKASRQHFGWMPEISISRSGRGCWARASCTTLPAARASACLVVTASAAGWPHIMHAGPVMVTVSWGMGPPGLLRPPGPATSAGLGGGSVDCDLDCRIRVALNVEMYRAAGTARFGVDRDHCDTFVGVEVDPTCVAGPDVGLEPGSGVVVGQHFRYLQWWD